MPTKKNLPAAQRTELFRVLAERFEKNPARHRGLVWAKVEAKLNASANSEKLWSLHEMERTGGEPDVVGQDAKTGEVIFFDCSPESPKGRVAVCYDRAGLDSRKEHKPAHSAVEFAAEMGIELLSPEQYRELQTLGEFDCKTSSWVLTPANIRKRPSFHLPQRRAVLLRRPRLPWCAARLKQTNIRGWRDLIA
jgi:Protein of unknown function (DUF4256)